MVVCWLSARVPSFRAAHAVDVATRESRPQAPQPVVPGQRSAAGSVDCPPLLRVRYNHPTAASPQSMSDDAGRLRVPSATEATGAYAGELELDLGNLLACDARGPDPNALQVSASRPAAAAAGLPLTRRAARTQDDPTGACITHGRDVVQRLIVRAAARVCRHTSRRQELSCRLPAGPRQPRCVRGGDAYKVARTASARCALLVPFARRGATHAVARALTLRRGGTCRTSCFRCRRSQTRAWLRVVWWSCRRHARGFRARNRFRSRARRRAGRHTPRRRTS